MKPLSLPRRLHLAYCSKPKADRAIYRLALKRKPKKIVEFGLGMALRATRLLTIAGSYAETEEIGYAGVDLFEARPASDPGTTLKRAHRILKPLGGAVRLVPGEPFPAIVQLANAVGQVDLIVIAAEHDDAALAPAWFYFPRMLKDSTIVLRESATGDNGRTKFVPVPHDEIQRLAAQGAPRRGKAA